MPVYTVEVVDREMQDRKMQLKSEVDVTESCMELQVENCWRAAAA